MFGTVAATEEQIYNIYKPGDIKIPRDIVLTHIPNEGMQTPTGINVIEL